VRVAFSWDSSIVKDEQQTRQVTVTNTLYQTLAKVRTRNIGSTVAGYAGGLVAQSAVTRIPVVDFYYVQDLAEVRHETAEESAKSFRISSGNRRVCTTFLVGSEVIGKSDTEQVE
jgi:hypothetical protein